MFCFSVAEMNRQLSESDNVTTGSLKLLGDKVIYTILVDDSENDLSSLNGNRAAFKHELSLGDADKALWQKAADAGKCISLFYKGTALGGSATILFSNEEVKEVLSR